MDTNLWNTFTEKLKIIIDKKNKELEIIHAAASTKPKN